MSVSDEVVDDNATARATKISLRAVPGEKSSSNKCFPVYLPGGRDSKSYTVPFSLSVPNTSNIVLHRFCKRLNCMSCDMLVVQIKNSRCGKLLPLRNSIAIHMSLLSGGTTNATIFFSETIHRTLTSSGQI